MKLAIVATVAVLAAMSLNCCEAKCKKKIVAIETKKIIPVAVPVYKKSKEKHPKTIVVKVPEKEHKCCCKKEHHKKCHHCGNGGYGYGGYGYGYPYYYDYVYYDYGGNYGYGYDYGGAYG